MQLFRNCDGIPQQLNQEDFHKFMTHKAKLAEARQQREEEVRQEGLNAECTDERKKLVEGLCLGNILDHLLLATLPLTCLTVDMPVWLLEADRGVLFTIS